LLTRHFKAIYQLSYYSFIVQGAYALTRSLISSLSYSRRLTARAQRVENAYAFWTCEGRDWLSAVRDLSVNGLFLITSVPEKVGASVKLHFLVSDGQVRAEAVVRHLEPGQGLGLKFTALNDNDRQRFSALMQRMGCNRPMTTKEAHKSPQRRRCEERVDMNEAVLLSSVEQRIGSGINTNAKSKARTVLV
jgi:PilZ domain